MIEVYQNRPIRVSVVLRHNSTGDPLVGIGSGNVTVYIRKNGEGSQVKSMDDSNFQQVDSTNMPGVYDVVFSAEDMSNLGDFVAIIQENPGLNLEEKYIQLRVVKDPQSAVVLPLLEAMDRQNEQANDDIEFLGKIESSATRSVAVQLVKKGSGPAESLEPATDLIWADVQASILKNGTYSALTLSNSTFSEIEAIEIPGWYQLEITSAETDQDGDVVVVLESLPVHALVDTPTSQILFGVALEGSDGFAVGNNGTVIETTDGAQTWVSSSFQSDVGPVSDNLNDIDDNGNGPLFATVGDNRAFYIKDGAGAWAAGDPLPAPGTGGDDALCISFAPSGIAQEAWIGGSGGAIWQYAHPSTTSVLQADSGTLGVIDITGIHAISTAEVWACGHDARLYKTTDGGTTWENVSDLLGDSGFTGVTDFTDIAFSGTFPDVGYIVGDQVFNDRSYSGRPLVFRTLDRGATWERINTGFNRFWERIVFETGSQGVAGIHTVRLLGSQGTVIVSHDGGTTWEREKVERVGNPFTAIRETIYDGVETQNSFAISLVGSDGTAYYGPTGQEEDVTATPPSRFNTKAVRFEVGDVTVDLSPITTSLDEAKGAGFDTATDSLRQLSGKVDDVQGSGFDTATGSLEQLRALSEDIQGSGFTSGGDSLSVLSQNLNDVSGDVSDVKADVTTIDLAITRLLGLSQENIRITDHTYDSNNNLTGSTITLYPSAGDVVAETNPLAVYQLTASYDIQGRLTDYRIERV